MAASIRAKGSIIAGFSVEVATAKSIRVSSFIKLPRSRSGNAADPRRIAVTYLPGRIPKGIPGTYFSSRSVISVGGDDELDPSQIKSGRDCIQTKIVARQF